MADVSRYYPRIPHAIDFVEIVICPNHGSERSAWDQAAANFSPRQMVDWLRATISACEATNEDEVTYLAHVAAEMRDPQFVTYVYGKLGLM